MPSTTMPESLAPLTNASGGFSMLAIDQRESLRTMLARATETTVADDTLVDFKSRAARTLTPHASAVLLDRAYGLQAAALRDENCAFILAADVLHHQVPGGPVTDATLDEDLTVELIHRLGANALKMLVPWLPEERNRAVDLAGRFMELCLAADLPGVVEGVVRPPDISSWSDNARNDALVEAARDLATVHPTLYKAEIPFYGRARTNQIADEAARITAEVDSPWVVLSSGVAAEDFHTAVTACHTGGAAGFLAGRAVWSDAITAADTDEFLRTESVHRLHDLAGAVAG